MMKKIVLFLIFLSFSSCYKNNLYVQQEWMDANFLASNFTDTPDPNRKNPPEGKRILISWDFPISIFRQHLSLFLTVRFLNNKQIVLFYPLNSKRGYKAYSFNEKENKILTYRVQVISKQGEILETWKHQFWTELIDLSNDKESTNAVK